MTGVGPRKGGLGLRLPHVWWAGYTCLRGPRDFVHPRYMVVTPLFENLYSPEIHPVANNMREHR